jgi:CheY-like chemotaxis protein
MNESAQSERPVNRAHAVNGQTTAGQTSVSKPVSGILAPFKEDDIKPKKENLTKNMSDRVEHAPLILVVDDEHAFCDVVAEILTSCGCKVIKAYDAGQGLNYLRHQTPDLILLDVMMPGIDGISFVRELRAEPDYRTLPIIVSSAKFQEDDRALASNAGADAYLTKPYSAHQLLEIVSRFLPQPINEGAH